jgi:hypothetical protein
MDFKSLSAFSRESVRACNVVRALPAYHEIMEHAKGALSVLAATGLLAHYSAASLRRALRSPRCAGCSGFGAFLFLPTCQRACVECLTQKEAFQVAPPDAVGPYFGLSEEQLTSIPKLRVLQGVYAAKPQRMGDGVMDLRGPDFLVSVKQARDLAAQLGVCPDSAESWNPDDALLASRWEHFMLSSPERGFGQTLGNFSNFKECPFSGPSYVRFPFLDQSGRVDHGRWCRGCLRTSSDLFTSKLPNEVRDEIGKQAVGGCVPTHITTMASRLWSEEAFMTHVTHCYGARVYSQRWHDVHQEMQQRGFRPRKMAPVKHITTAPNQSTLHGRLHPELEDSYQKLAIDAQNKVLIEEHRQYVGDLTDSRRPLQFIVVSGYSVWR